MFKAATRARAPMNNDKWRPLRDADHWGDYGRSLP
jgi:hypothetical protein